MIKNIIFDLGNVLLEFNPIEYLNGKIKNSDNVPKVFNAIFRSEEWPMLDRGTIEEDVAINNIITRNMELEEDIKAAFDNWYDILIEMKETVEILKKLKDEGYKIYYLSNFHKAAFKVMVDKYEFFKLFDGGVVSYEEKILKPESEIYLKLADKYSLKLQECLFLDDTDENVQAATNLGMKGIVFQNIDEVKKDIKIYLNKED